MSAFTSGENWAACIRGALADNSYALQLDVRGGGLRGELKRNREALKERYGEITCHVHQNTEIYVSKRDRDRHHDYGVVVGQCRDSVHHSRLVLFGAMGLSGPGTEAAAICLSSGFPTALPRPSTRHEHGPIVYAVVVANVENQGGRRRVLDCDFLLPPKSWHPCAGG